MRIRNPPKCIMSISIIMSLIMTLLVFQCGRGGRGWRGGRGGCGGRSGRGERSRPAGWLGEKRNWVAVA